MSSDNNNNNNTNETNKSNTEEKIVINNIPIENNFNSENFNCDEQDNDDELHNSINEKDGPFSNNFDIEYEQRLEAETNEVLGTIFGQIIMQSLKEADKINNNTQYK